MFSRGGLPNERRVGGVMKVNDALLKSVDDGKWFRPKRWTGTGSALMVGSYQQILKVPSKIGGDTLMSFLASDLLDEWDVVDPCKVNSEVAEAIHTPKAMSGRKETATP